MRAAFDTLLKVQFNHNYFSDGLFSGFSIKISDGTLRLLNNAGLLFKPQPSGFYILYDQNSAGLPRTKEEVKQENIRLEFFLNVNDPYFYGYTEDMPDDIANSVFYFHNSSNTGQGTQLLHVNEFVSQNDAYNFKYFKQPFFSKPFAKLDLLISPDTEEAYYINFQARSTYWRYIFIQNSYLNGLVNPAILGSDDSNIFKISQVKLPDDRVVDAFVSLVKLNLCQNASRNFKTFKLVGTDEKTADSRVVIANLPIADPRLVSRIKKNDEGAGEATKPINYSEYSDILIH